MKAFSPEDKILSMSHREKGSSPIPWQLRMEGTSHAESRKGVFCVRLRSKACRTNNEETKRVPNVRSEMLEGGYVYGASYGELMLKALATTATMQITMTTVCSIVSQVKLGVGGKRLEWWVHQFLCLTHHAVVGVWALYALIYDPVCWAVVRGVCNKTVEGAHRLNYETSRYYMAILLPLTIGYMFFDMIQLYRTKELNMLITVHHGVSIILWPLLVHFDVAHMWILYFLSTELTGPFNVIRKMLSEAKYKESKLYIVNGLIFTTLFVLWRIVPIPTLVSVGWLANPFDSSTVPTSLTPNIVILLKVAYLFSYLPLAFNMYWGFYVVNGACKALLCSQKKRNKTC